MNHGSVLLFILSIGFLLRISIVFWGWQLLPHVYCPEFQSACIHADESQSYWAIMTFPESLITTNHFLGYGSTLPLLLGAPLLSIRTAIEHHLQSPHLYGSLVVIFARLSSVVFGVASILFTYLLTDILIKNKKIALLSATLVTLAPMHVLASANGKPTIAMSLFIPLITWLAFSVFSQEQTIRKPLNIIVLGVLSGALTGLKLTGVFIIAIPILIMIIKGRFSARETLLYVGVAFFAYILMNPIILIHTQEYIHFYQHQKHEWIDNKQAPILEILKYWSHHTNTAHGFIIVPFLLGGIFFAAKNRMKEVCIPFAYIAMYYIFWRMMPGTEDIVPVIPLIAIYAPLSLHWLLSKKVWVINFIALFLVICITGATIQSLAAALYTRYRDPRIEASKYIHRHVPLGSSIGFTEVSTEYGWQGHRWRHPPIDITRYALTHFLDKPDYLIANSFDIDEITGGLRKNAFSSPYVWDQNYKTFWYSSLPPSPEVFMFYENLSGEQSDYQLIKEFLYPFDRNSVADGQVTISIYKKISGDAKPLRQEAY